LQTTLPATLITLSGKLSGWAAGTLSALAERFDKDFEQPDLALRLSAIHDWQLTDAAKIANDDYQAAWANAYLTAYRAFNQPLTLAQAYEGFCLVQKVLAAI